LPPALSAVATDVTSTKHKGTVYPMFLSFAAFSDFQTVSRNDMRHKTMDYFEALPSGGVAKSDVFLIAASGPFWQAVLRFSPFFSNTVVENILEAEEQREALEDGWRR
jgi:hypothetical protein